MRESDDVYVRFEDSDLVDLRKRHRWGQLQSEINGPARLRSVAGGVTLRTRDGSPVLRFRGRQLAHLLGERRLRRNPPYPRHHAVARVRSTVAKVRRDPAACSPQLNASSARLNHSIPRVTQNKKARRCVLWKFGNVVELSGYCPPSPKSRTNAFSRLSFEFDLLERTPRSRAYHSQQTLYLAYAPSQSRMPARVHDRKAKWFGPTLHRRWLA